MRVDGEVVRVDLDDAAVRHVTQECHTVLCWNDVADSWSELSGGAQEQSRCSIAAVGVLAALVGLLSPSAAHAEEAEQPISESVSATPIQLPGTSSTNSIIVYGERSISARFRTRRWEDGEA